MNTYSELKIKIKNSLPTVLSCERTVLCALKKGSLTVEASLALPLFFMITICIISIMGVYGKVQNEMIELRNTAENAALYVSSDSGEDWIALENIVVYKPYCLPAGLASLYIPVSAKVRAWTGWDGSTSDTGGSSGESSSYVYLTDNASVYHTDPSCTHLSLSISTTSSFAVAGLKNQYGSHYHACEKCVGSGLVNSTVYITSEGDCYHNSAECSGLKRSVRLVSVDEVNGLSECSRCAAKGN